MASTWTIHNKDGKHLGDSRAMSAKVAFILHLSDRGVASGLRDLQAEPLPDGRVRITHQGDVYLLTKTPE